MWSSRRLKNLNESPGWPTSSLRVSSLRKFYSQRRHRIAKEMPPLKKLARPSKIAWCPSSKYPELLATGNVQGTIDANFETTSTLEIFDMSLGSGSQAMLSKGQVVVNESFTSLAWGIRGAREGTYPCGLLAGGMSDGTVHFWNAHAMMNNTPSLLARADNAHRGPVSGIDFHPANANLLASCGADGQVLVWDLKDASKPTHPPSLEKRTDSLTNVKWNKSVIYILAASNTSGETAIYDLRHKKTVMTLRNSMRQNLRANCFSWNPGSGVSMAVSYQGSPVIEIWDLRQAMQPKLIIDAKSNMLSMDWCSHDPNLLVASTESTNREGNLSLWHAETGRHLRDYNQEGNTCFDTLWNPHLPSILLTSSYQGHVSVQSLHHAGPVVPAWCTRPCGVSFGFGGKLVYFSNATTTDPTGSVCRNVKIDQVTTDDTLSKLAGEFQDVIASDSFEALCAKKVISSSNDAETSTWKFLSVLFNPDVASRHTALLKELGFQAPPPVPANVASAVTSVAKAPPKVTDISEEGFFDLLGSANDEVEQESKVDSPVLVERPPTSLSSSAPVNTVETEEDKTITRALTTGDFVIAVDTCLRVGRIADALVFSQFSRNEMLMQKTRDAFFETHRHKFTKNVFRFVFNNDIGQLAVQSDIADWRQTVAVLLSYAPNNVDGINQLASRLLAAGQNSNAMFCFLCAGNIDGAAEVWLSSSSSETNPLVILHNAVEKIATFSSCLRKRGVNVTSKLISDKYVAYASALTAQGNLAAALSFLKLATAGGTLEEETKFLMDRISHSLRVVPTPSPAASRPTPQQHAPQQPPQHQGPQQQLSQHQGPRQTAMPPSRAAPVAKVSQLAPLQPMPANPVPNPTSSAPGPREGIPSSSQPAVQPLPPASRPSQPQPGLPPTSLPQPFQPQTPQYQPLPPSQSSQPQPFPTYQPQTGQPQFPQRAPPNHLQAPQNQPVASHSPAAPPPFRSQTGMPFQSGASQMPPQGMSSLQPPASQLPPQGMSSLQPPASQLPPQGLSSLQPPAKLPPQGMPSFQPQASQVPPQQAVSALSRPTTEPPTAAAPTINQALSPEHKDILNVFNGLLATLDNLKLKPHEKKKITDVQARTQDLQQQMATGEGMSPTVTELLAAVATALQSRDFNLATKQHTTIVSNHWDGNSRWLPGLKSLIGLAKTYKI